MTLIKKKLRYLLSHFYATFLFVFLLNNICSGQTTNTNQGNDFWFCFPANHDMQGVIYTVDITAFYSTTGTISIPLQGYSQPFTVAPGTVTRYTIPNIDAAFDQEGIFNYAVNVVSAGPIEVFYDESSSGPRNDNSYVLPDTLLGNNYYITTYNGYPGSNNDPAAQFIITTPGDTVRVQITPTVNTAGGHAANVPYDTTIYPGEVYNVRSTGLQDLTGTQVIAADTSNPTQKFSISAGMDIGSMGCNGTVDPAFEEMIPVMYWGKSYIFVPISGITDICRVVACQNNTQVTINGTVVATLSAGGYYDQLTSTPSYISANNPINCVRFLLTEGNLGQGCNGSNSLGDPDMIIVQPNEQMYMDSITFYASCYDNTYQGITNSWIQVVTRTSDVNNVFLDGTSIGSDFTPLAQGPSPNEYSYAAVNITVPTNITTNIYHQLTTTGCGFLAYMEGLGSVTSVGSAAGVYLRFPNGGKASTTNTQAHCSNCDGTATVNVVGGVGPFIYSWSDGNRQTTQTATGLCAGTYTVVIQERCNVGNDTATVVVPNGSAPEISDSIKPSNTVCAGTPVTISIYGGSSYTWSNNASSSTINITPTSDTTYSVVVGNGICSPVNESFSITVNPVPTVTISPDTSICKGDTATLNVTGGGTYAWYDGSSVAKSTASSFSVTLSSTQTYSAVVTKNGCVDTSLTTITVNPYPTFKVTGSNEICAGQNITLIASSGATSYSWAPATGLSCSCPNPLTSSTVVAAPSGNITYTVTGTSNGCSTAKTVSITIVPLPVAGFYPSPDSIDVGGTINFVSLSTNTVSNLWILGDGTTSGDSIVSHQYNEAGAFTVYLVVYNSLGCADSIAEDVYVNPPIKVPNVFTPNGDNSNDQFVITAEGVENYNIQIFDRWGKKVFESESLSDSWTGKNTSGEMESDGIYYYVIKASDFTGRKYSLNGYLQLIKD